MSNITNPGPIPFTDVGYASSGFITVSAALVFIMTPGVGLFYAGMVKAKNALSLIFLSLLSVAVVTFQWFLFGFSITFAETGGPIIGDFTYAFLNNVQNSALPLTASGIPIVTFALYQLQFAAITPSIIFGSIAERTRLLPSLVFVFFWSTFVYDFVAYWTWSAHGWARNLSCLELTKASEVPCLTGALDFAGGGPVHIASGFAGLAACVYLGARKTAGPKPHNVTMVFLGTVLIWFGWYGFNGGSALAATGRASMAALVTTLCASVSGLSWILFDYIFSRKLSGIGFCSGAIAGLVVITPASGFVGPWASVVMGIIGGISINLSLKLKNYLKYDDALDAFAIHGLGGVVGNILTGIFHQKWVSALDGTVTNGGAIDGNPLQIGYQIAVTFAIAGWSFVVTYLLLFVIDRIPGLNLHVSADQEEMGVDMGEMGEIAYGFHFGVNGSTTGTIVEAK